MLTGRTDPRRAYLGTDPDGATVLIVGAYVHLSNISDRLLDLLHEADENVRTVAEIVGYSMPFALSAACKRVRGMSPQEHRAMVRSATCELALTMGGGTYR